MPATKVWNNPADNPRPEHDIDGEEVDIGDTFSNGLDAPDDGAPGCVCYVDVNVTLGDQAAAPDSGGGEDETTPADGSAGNEDTSSSGYQAPPEIPIRTSDDIQTVEDLNTFAQMVPSISTDGTENFFTHAVSNDDAIDSILQDGLKPDQSDNVYLSKPPLVRDTGNGYVVARVPVGEAEDSEDVVEAHLRYPQSTVSKVDSDNIVKAVREVRYTDGSGHGIREDKLASYAAKHQGLDNEEVKSLPEKYQKWFALSEAADTADLVTG
jgi:hypothetical protein